LSGDFLGRQGRFEKLAYFVIFIEVYLDEILKMAPQTPYGGRFSHLPGAPEQQRLPVGGLFPAPGKERLIYSPVKIDGFHILLFKLSVDVDKMQVKNKANLKKVMGKIYSSQYPALL
jgi:hypothetical protein